MDGAACADLSPEDKTIRKIRKKLRQIENLEILDRDLNGEELIKVSKKHDLRKDLQVILKKHRPDETDFMKRQGPRLLDEEGDFKRVRSVPSSEKDYHEDDKASDDDYMVACNDVPSPTPSSSRSSRQQPLSAMPDASKKSTQKSGIFINTTPVPVHATSSTSSSPSSPTRDKPVQAQVTTGNKKQKPKETPFGESEKRERCPWKDGTFEVFTLKGHHDIVLSVDCTREYVLSGSRDTTVRVWRVGKCVEERSLRGHTSAVTSVAFLPHPLAASVITKCQTAGMVGVSESSVVGVSGGLDCTLRVWDVVSGESLGSIYTYNGITCLACCSWGVMTGTEGGRLEFWSLVDKLRTAYVDAFHSQVSAMHASEGEVCAGSVDGEVGVWRITSDGHNATTLYMMEPESATFVPLRRLAAVIQCRGKLYLGDSGPNIKVLAWRNNSVRRLINHIGEVGLTDSITLALDGHILAASYFIDTGCPSINVRDPDGGYKCTLLDCEEGRYLALGVAEGVIVSAGHTLKVWVHRSASDGQRKRKSQGCRTVYPTFLRRMSADATESGTEEDTDWASSSEDEEEDRRRLMEAAGREVAGVGDKGEGKWWCSVL